MPNKTPSIQQLYWHEIRDRVLKVKPELAAIIDDIDPGRKYSFYLARYPFGVKIYDQGVIYYPDEKKYLLAQNDANLPTDLTKNLNYSTFPVALLMKKNVEIFIEPAGRMVPLRLIEQGDIIGMWESLQPAILAGGIRPWSISSGARSIFLLPKITDATRHARLRREFGVHSSVPRNLDAHWKVFTELANHRNFSKHWFSELLFFSGEWFNNKNDPAWNNFNYFLYKHAWMQTINYRNKEILNYIWEDFTLALSNKNIKPKPHLIDTFKHLICMAMGLTPGFRPANSDDTVGPIKTLQDIYVNTYGIKEYIPTIMQPYHLKPATPELPAYYSLHSPTLMETYPKPKLTTSIIADLRELKSLTDALNERLHLDGTIIHHFLKDVKIEYFHSEVDALAEIHSSKNIAIEDPQFTQWHGKDGSRSFSDNSPFVRGCIRISSQSEL